MSSMTAHFGLGQDNTVAEVEVRWPSGIITTLTDVPANSTLNIVESISTALTTAPERGSLRVYPNPTEGLLTVELRDLGKVQRTVVLDVAGKQVLTPTLLGGRVDVSTLAPGMYRLVVESEGRSHTSSFVRE
ncbi:MAG TPA: ASPIC/UnbV domain-containing protein, partial [Flavobacteriales bacterium]|nr:ASPIC/UnbV domain-containing protein [Flavobacteriales bacterium]